MGMYSTRKTELANRIPSGSATGTFSPVNPGEEGARKGV